jgi:hypothetical protein
MKLSYLYVVCVVIDCVEEVQLDLQAVTVFLVADAEDLHKELNLTNLKTRIDIQATKTLVEIMRLGLEIRLAGVEARPDLGCCGEHELAQAQCSHLSLMHGHHKLCSDGCLKPWQSTSTATYLIAALNEPAAHILHGVRTKATYEEVTEALENCHGDHNLESEFYSQLKSRTSSSGNPCRSVLLPPNTWLIAPTLNYLNS